MILPSLRSYTQSIQSVSELTATAQSSSIKYSLFGAPPEGESGPLFGTAPLPPEAHPTVNLIRPAVFAPNVWWAVHHLVYGSCTNGLNRYTAPPRQ